MAGQGERMGNGKAEHSSFFPPLPPPPTRAGLLLHALHLGYLNKVSPDTTDQWFKKQKLKNAGVV